MSYITEILVQGPRNMDDINAWLLENDSARRQQFHSINMDAAGGTKYYVTHVWAAAFNHGPMGDLIPMLRDPATWGTSVLLVSVSIHGEESSEAFVFDRVGEVYQPVTAQEHRW